MQQALLACACTSWSSNAEKVDCAAQIHAHRVCELLERWVLNLSGIRGMSPYPRNNIRLLEHLSSLIAKTQEVHLVDLLMHLAHLRMHWYNVSPQPRTIDANHVHA